MYTKITIFQHTFSSYWALFLLGCFLMAGINLVRRKQLSFSVPRSLLYTFLLVFFSLSGAKILYYLENVDVLIQSGVRLDGVSFFGSVFFLPVGMAVVCRLRGLSCDALLDMAAPSLMAMLAVLRLACWANGCCGGIHYTTSTGLTRQVPTQLIEFWGDLAILAILLVVEWSFRVRGLLYPCILLLYGFLRFFVEFVRDTPKNWLYLSHGQWFAAISVIAGAWLIMKKTEEMRREQKHRRANRYANRKKRK